MANLPYQMIAVITSYSIHYTKLYERGCRDCSRDLVAADILAEDLHTFFHGAEITAHGAGIVGLGGTFGPDGLCLVGEEQVLV